VNVPKTLKYTKTLSLGGGLLSQGVLAPTPAEKQGMSIFCVNGEDKITHQVMAILYLIEALRLLTGSHPELADVHMSLLPVMC
jgi:hypothetical protein